MIRANLEFDRENSRIEIRCQEANLSDWRHVGEEEQQLFRRWIDSYRHALRSHSHNYHNVLFRIGQDIYNWLNGTENWLKEFFTSSTNPPFILECRVSSSPREDELRFLEVPWELLADQHHHLAEDQYKIYCPVRRIGNPKETEKPSPFLLHTIFMAATPLGSVSLRYEEEEAAILDAAGTAGMDLIVEESGTLNLLAECMSKEMQEHPVDVLHISCHGNHKGGPVLLLENEEGKPCPTMAYQLNQKLGSHKPKLLFLSACMTSEPDSLLNSFSADMVRRGISAVLGWGGAVKDIEATRFASFFYGRLSLCEELVEALARSRLDLLEDVQNKSSNQRARDWHLARLYLGERGGGILSKGQIPWRRIKPDYVDKEFLDAKGEIIPVATHREFVGRRRQIQRILKEFNSPTHAGVLIHGFGGQGKTSLAARIAYRLKDHQLVVIYGCYNALSLLDTIEDRAGNPELNDLIASQKDAVLDNPKQLCDLLKEILEGPCLRVEKDDKGKVIRRPLLLVIDDFEQILESPHQEEFHKVRSDLVHTVRSVIRAFDISIGETKTRSRLLITSRYRFALFHKGQNLTSKLLHIHLPSMEEFESRKQMVTKEKIMGLIPGAIDSKRVERCIHTAGGNPWLQDMFFSLYRNAPQTCDQVLIAVEEFIKCGQEPTDTKLLNFIKKLEIQHLIKALSFGERELLRISTLFQIPVPLTIFELIAINLEVKCPEPFCNRLLGFGLWEPIDDMVNPEYKAVSICTLVLPFAGHMKENESTEVARLIVKDLFAMWGGVKKRNRPYAADIQLVRLALKAKDLRVLIDTANDAVRGLEKRFQYKDAAELGKEAIQILDETSVVVPASLLRSVSEVSEIIGEIKDAQTYIKQALNILSSQKETDEYAYALIIYGGQLVLLQ